MTFRRLRADVPILLASFLAGVAVSGCERRTAALATPDPGGSYQIEWVSVNAPATLKTSEVTTVPVTVRNAGSAPIASAQLALSYHWNDAADPQRVIVWDGLRTAVGRPLGPGESYAAGLRVQAPDRPGEYLLNVDLVREGVAWFSKKGSPTSSHPVSVR